LDVLPGGRYGRKNGICEACGSKLKGHPRCESCGLLTGLRHVDDLIEYRNHNLCLSCMVTWKKEEKKNKNKLIDWEQFFTHGWSKAELRK